MTGPATSPSFKGHRLIRAVHRLARLLVGRNPLRRPYDRIEGAVLLTLAVAFLAAMAGASLVGAHLYQSQRAADAGLHRATAVLIQGGPDSRLTSAWEVLARWPGAGWQGKIRCAHRRGRPGYHQHRRRHPGAGLAEPK